MRTILLTGILCLSCSLGFSQIKIPGIDTEEGPNLVPDPSFEEVMDLPCGWNQGLGKFDDWMTHWQSPTQTTPDLFSTRVATKCWSHPTKHSEGKQRPRNGDNMVGIKCYGKGGTDSYWHEYIKVELSEPLKADTLYYVGFYANLAHRASKHCNNIGALITSDTIKTRDRKPLYITPTINSEKPIKQSILGWKKVDGVFKAQGGERYLIIGNFYRDSETRMERMDKGKDGAYYYIDDVKVRRALPNEKVSPKPKESRPAKPLVVLEERADTEEVEISEVEYEVGTTIELRNIAFEIDKAELLPESQKELNRLADLMHDHPFMAIEISGHTDDTGSATYNQRLSEARAQAVAAYLMHKDVEQKRLDFKGFGSIMPVASNDTEEGRKMNRRVEFKVTQM